LLLNAVAVSAKSFSSFELGKVLSALRRAKKADLSLSLFEALSALHGAHTNNELLSLLILTLIENGRLEAAKYWIERYLECFPILCAELMRVFFAQYMTYPMTAPRLRRCQGRDRLILRRFYDELVLRRGFDAHSNSRDGDVDDADDRNHSVSLDKRVLYELEFGDAQSLRSALSDESRARNVQHYRSASECLEHVFAQIMTRNQITFMTRLLTALFLDDRDGDESAHSHSELLIRCFFPLFRFLSNHGEFALISRLFERLDGTSKVAITSNKMEVLLDDASTNLPVLLDFGCLATSESDRVAVTVSGGIGGAEGENVTEYADPSAAMVRLWKRFYFANRHTDKALIHRLFHYFRRRDKFEYDAALCLVDRDENVRFARYFMREVLENEDVFAEDVRSDREEVQKEALCEQMRLFYSEAYQHCDRFSKRRQKQDLDALLRQL